MIEHFHLDIQPPRTVSSRKRPHSEDEDDTLDEIEPITITPYKISKRLQTLLTKLYDPNKDLFCDHIKYPCSFCGRRLRARNVVWHSESDHIDYPLTLQYPDISIVRRTDNKVVVCESCHSSKTRMTIPNILRMPKEIQDVPKHCRHLLAPVALGCSVGRAAGSNYWTTYEKQTGKKKNNCHLNQKCSYIFHIYD